MASTWIDPGTFEMPTTIPDSFEGLWSTYSSFEEDTITRALQVSLSSHGGDDSTTSSSCDPSPHSIAPPPPFRHVGTGRVPAVAGPTGRVGKRKPRASRRAPVTYIEADPANFREMVQMITGVQVAGAAAEGEAAAATAKVKRPSAMATATATATAPVGFMPTLDTSASLLDRAAAGVAMGGAAEEVGLEGFPTLESWGSLENLEF